MPGRPRKPSRLLEAKGAFKKNPQRKREGEPVVSEPLGPAPDYFNDDQRECFRMIADRAPMGVLTSADTMLVEMAATLFADYRRAYKTWDALEAYIEKDNHEDPDGASKLADELRRVRSVFGPAQYAQLRALLNQFGMGPADRSKLNIAAPAKNASKFDKRK